MNFSRKTIAIVLGTTFVGVLVAWIRATPQFGAFTDWVANLFSVRAFASHGSEADSLNQLGLLIINIDARYVALVALAIAAFLILIKSVRSKAWPTAGELAAGLLALLSLYSAVVVGAIFVLTRPPAIERLTEVELVGVGLVSFLVLLLVSLREVYCKFIEKESSDSDKKSQIQISNVSNPPIKEP